MRRFHVPIRFVGGRRVTSPAALMLVRRTLAEVNDGALQRRRPARGRPARRRDRPRGDAGAGARAGRRAAAEPPAAGRGRARGRGRSRSSRRSREGPLNVNADEAAAALAIGLGARAAAVRHGRRRRPAGRARSCQSIEAVEADRLLSGGVLEGGIVPKLRAAVTAARLGVRAEIGETAVVAMSVAARLARGCCPTYARQDVTFVAGEGAWLVDAEGRRYLDFLAGIAVVGLGHLHPAPLAAAQCSARATLARVEPLLDGADGRACRAPVRPLRRRPGVLLQLGRGGDRGRAQVRAQGDRQARRRRARGLLPRAHLRRALRDRPARRSAPRSSRSFQGVAFAQPNDRRVTRRGRDGATGCILLEPVQGEGGIHPLSPNFVATARALADELGALLVLDEVQTGVGRTGTLLLLRAARRPPGRGHAREGARERAPDRLPARLRRRGRRLRARRPRLHLRRQPRRRRGGRRRLRRARRRAPRARSARPGSNSHAALPRSPASSRFGVSASCSASSSTALPLRSSTPAATAASWSGSAGERVLRLTPPLDDRPGRRGAGARCSSRRLSMADRFERQGAIMRLVRERAALDPGRARRGAARGRLSTSSRRRSRATSPRLGLVKVRNREGRLVYALPGAEDLDRLNELDGGAAALGALGDAVGEPRRHPDARRASRARWRTRSTVRSSAQVAGTIAGREHDLRRRRRRRHRRRAGRRAVPPPGRRDMSGTAVLAYSGGLDTSCAIAWLKEDYGFDEVVAVLVDVGQEAEPEAALERGRLAGADDVVVLDRTRGVRRRPGGEGAARERPLRGPLPARLRALAAGDRGGRGGDRARARRRGGRARLHRQGQRPAPLRARVQGEVPRRARDRAAPRPRLDARRGDRLRARARDPGRGARGQAVLDRRQPVRAGDRGRDPRGPVAGAARGRVRAHGLAARRTGAHRGRARVRGGPARPRSTARSCSCTSSSPR